MANCPPGTLRGILERAEATLEHLFPPPNTDAGRNRRRGGADMAGAVGNPERSKEVSSDLA